jgi:hypothetical protein
MFDPKVEVQESGERWLQQRAEFRRENLRRLREREGIRAGDHDLIVNGENVREWPYKTGHRPWAATISAEEEATGVVHFDLPVPDSADLARELDDLVRDAQAFQMAEAVRHIDTPPSPAMADVILGSDESLDQWLQEELERRQKL